LLFYIFQLLTFIAKGFSGMRGCTGDLVDSLMR
jgi:hypothetical protein